MREKLMNYLVCPVCSGIFTLEKEEVKGEHVITGTLNCVACRVRYSIKNGIPRILSPTMRKEMVRTAESFGYEWKRFNELEKRNENEFLSYLDPLGAEDFHGKVVLDAGCGMGKFTYFASRYNAKEVIAVDLSESVEVAFEHTKNFSNVHVVQSDIYNLPLGRQFDFIYSIGVLHHLPEPEIGFSRLATLLKAKGTIFAWVYGKEGNWLYITFAEPIRKHVTSKLPLWLNEFFALIIAVVLWPALIFVYIPFNKFGLARFLPMFEYFLYFSKLSFRIFWATILDKMIPPVSYYYSQKEFQAWFDNAGLKHSRVMMRNGNSWKGFGKKE